MKIGIIYYSHSGNTESVARRLYENLISCGHIVKLEEITVDGEVTPGNKEFLLTNAPAVEGYDSVIFGSPVQAFALNPAMIRYLEQIASLQGVSFTCFITKQLPLSITGAKQAVNKIKELGEAKGGNFCGSDYIIWSKADREQKIEEVVNKLSRILSE